MAHIGNKTRKLDITASPICVDKERERCVCGCCAAAEYPYSVCWPIEKNNHVDGSLKGLKSHAYHILMQQILPLCVCTIMRKEVRICIIRLSRVFKRLCAKTINPLEMNDLRKDTAIILCMVEKKNSTGIFWRHDTPFGTLGGGTRYLWASTCPLHVPYGEVLENIEGLCSESRKIRS